MCHTKQTYSLHNEVLLAKLKTLHTSAYLQAIFSKRIIILHFILLTTSASKKSIAQVQIGATIFRLLFCHQQTLSKQCTELFVVWNATVKKSKSVNSGSMRVGEWSTTTNPCSRKCLSIVTPLGGRRGTWSCWETVNSCNSSSYGTIQIYSMSRQTPHVMALS
jgi:hypothetical protein